MLIWLLIFCSWCSSWMGLRYLVHAHCISHNLMVVFVRRGSGSSHVLGFCWLLLLLLMISVRLFFISCHGKVIPVVRSPTSMPPIPIAYSQHARDHLEQVTLLASLSHSLLLRLLLIHRTKKSDFLAVTIDHPKIVLRVVRARLIHLIWLCGFFKWIRCWWFQLAMLALL